jgi:ATP synthase protein I
MSIPTGSKDRDSSSLAAGEKVQIERRLSDLGEKLGKAGVPQQAQSPAGAGVDEARGRALGMGFGIAAQLVAGVGIGGLFGYSLDRWLATAPWLMALFLVFGFAAGLMSVIRTAREMEKISEAQSVGAKSVPDDEAEDR